MRYKAISAAICAALLGAAPIPGIALAQVGTHPEVSDYPQRHSGATPGNPRAQNNPDAVNDARLHKSAAAFVSIQRLSANGTVSAAQKNNAVKEAGLSPVEYRHVMRLVKIDKPLRQKFVSYVQADGGNLPPGTLHE